MSAHRTVNPRVSSQDSTSKAVQAGLTSQSGGKGKKLSKAETRLLKRILRSVLPEHPVWAESNTEVAKVLGVDRSTVVRTIRKLKDHSVLFPVDIKGGRGVPFSYEVDIEKAKGILKTRYWPAHPALSSDQDRPQGQLRFALPQSLAGESDLPKHLPNPTLPGSVTADWQYVPHPDDAFDPQAFFQDLIGICRDAFNGLRERLPRLLKDPVFWRMAGLVGSVGFDVWAVYTVCRKEGLLPALLTAVPASTATYAWWSLLRDNAYTYPERSSCSEACPWLHTGSQKLQAVSSDLDVPFLPNIDRLQSTTADNHCQPCLV